jgi:predicted alpha/beta-fold hydrolase
MKGFLHPNLAPSQNHARLHPSPPWRVRKELFLTATTGKAELSAMDQTVTYQSIKVDGLSIFYRESGDRRAPTIILLHGLPSSSRMYQSLLRRLASQYHLIAPDYRGFGHSDWPNPSEFEYTFDRIAAVMERFIEALGIRQYALYMHWPGWFSPCPRASRANPFPYHPECSLTR